MRFLMTQRNYGGENSEKCAVEEDFFYDAVLKVFKRRASKHIINTLAKARENERRKAKRPLWMAEKIWNDLLKGWKECPKFLKRPETNKRSRSVAAEIGLPPYAGGSIPVSAHKELLVAYDNLVDQATEFDAMTEESPPVNLNRLWIDVTGGVKNGLSVFWMGSDARAMIEMNKYSSSYQTPFCQDNGENMQEKMRGSIQEVREEITRHNQRWENMFGQLIQGQKTLVETMNSLATKKGSRRI